MAERRTEYAMREARWRAVAAFTLLSLFECAILMAGWHGQVGWNEVLVLHVASVFACGAVVFLFFGDRTAAVTGVLATLSIGPVGAVAVACMLLRLQSKQDETSRCSDWMDRIHPSSEHDRDEALYHAIVTGRAYQPGGLPKAIGATMREAPADDRVKVLSRIVAATGSVPGQVLSAGLTDEHLSVRAATAAIQSRQVSQAADVSEGRA